MIELYKQGKTRRQIAEIVHMSFKDIADIINEYTDEDKQVNNKEDLIELAINGLPNLRARFEGLLNQVTVLENEKNSLSTEILGLRNSIYTNNEIIRKQNVQLRSLAKKQSILEIMLRNAVKERNYEKVIKIVDQRLNDKRSLLVALS